MTWTTTPSSAGVFVAWDAIVSAPMTTQWDGVITLWDDSGTVWEGSDGEPVTWGDERTFWVE